MRLYNTLDLHSPRLRDVISLIIICLISVGLLCLGPLSSSATITVKTTLREAINQAHLIIHGTVMKQVSHRENNRVISLITVRTHDILKGHEQFKGGASHTVMIKQIGGEYNGLTQRIAGAPSLVEGSEWILFLAPAPSLSESLGESDQTTPLYIVKRHIYGAHQVKKRPHGVKVIDGQYLRAQAPSSPPSLGRSIIVPIKRFRTLQLTQVATAKESTVNKGEVSHKTKAQPIVNTSPIKLKRSFISSQSQREIELKQYIEELKREIDKSAAPPTADH